MSEAVVIGRSLSHVTSQAPDRGLRACSQFCSAVRLAAWSLSSLDAVPLTDASSTELATAV